MGSEAVQLIEQISKGTSQTFLRGRMARLKDDLGYDEASSLRGETFQGPFPHDVRKKKHRAKA